MSLVLNYFIFSYFSAQKPNSSKCEKGKLQLWVLYFLRDVSKKVTTAIWRKILLEIQPMLFYGKGVLMAIFQSADTQKPLSADIIQFTSAFVLIFTVNLDIVLVYMASISYSLKCEKYERTIITLPNLYITIYWIVWHIRYFLLSPNALYITQSFVCWITVILNRILIWKLPRMVIHNKR